MASSVQQLDSDVEVPEAAFDDDITDLDFHLNPMPDTDWCAELPVIAGYGVGDDR